MPLVKRAVDGPVSAVQDNIVIFDDSTGKKLKDSGKALSDYVEEGDARLTDARDPTAHALDAHTAVTLAELNAVISDATLATDAAATTSVAGLMSAADKVRLDAMADSANNYAHPNHSGDVTSVADGATTIANDAVTNEKLANMATKTVKGRNTANTGDPEDLDMSTLKTMLDATTTPTASSIPVADSGGKIADGWIPATVARLASPALTGTPTAPTQAVSDNTTKLATTAHVKSVLADYVANTHVRTILSGVVDPTTEGEDGDFYINTSSWEIFGPKATTWPAGVPMVGADGAPGADGRTILSGTVDPTTEGEDGDFYINTATTTLFGPKNVTWPAGVSLVGPAGADGTGIPPISEGDSGKVLAVKIDESGTEWVDAPSGSGSGVGDKLYLYNRVSGAF